MAKHHYRTSVAFKLGEKYMSGSPIRQDYLETVLGWLSGGNIEQYMAEHQNDANADNCQMLCRDCNRRKSGK